MLSKAADFIKNSHKFSFISNNNAKKITFECFITKLWHEKFSIKTIAGLPAIKMLLCVEFVHLRFSVYLLINCVKAMAIVNSIDFCCLFAFMVANNEPGIREKNDNKMSKNISITTYPFPYPLSIDLLALFFPLNKQKYQNKYSFSANVLLTQFCLGVHILIICQCVNGTQFPTNTRTYKLNTDDEIFFSFVQLQKTLRT